MPVPPYDAVIISHGSSTAVTDNNRALRFRYTYEWISRK